MYNKEELKSRYTGVSASFLNWFDISPLYAKQKLDGIIKDDSTKEQELGIQLHVYVLEHQKFKENYLYKNFDLPRGDKQKEFCELCSTMKITNPEYKALDIALPCYRATYSTDKKSDEKIKDEALKLYQSLQKYIKYLEIKDNYKGTIDYSSMNYIKEAYQVIKTHESASALLFNDTNDFISSDDLFIQNEFRIYWEEPSILLNNKPLVIKSIIDRLIIDFKQKEIFLIDLKTSKKLYKFYESFGEYKYDRQLALYWKAVEYYFKKQFTDYNWNDFTLHTRIVAVQTPNIYQTLPVECQVVNIQKETLMEGNQKLNESLDDIAWHFENNKWSRKRRSYGKDYDLLI